MTEDPKANFVEIWSFANTTGDVHPIHVHLLRFRVLNRQPFDTRTYLQTGQLVFAGIPIAPERNEPPGGKGTRFTPGQEFRYVWHCHMLEHEDNETMRPYNVISG